MMQFNKTKNSLQVQLPGDFNLVAVQGINKELHDRKELLIDLQHSRFINSEAIRFLHKSMMEGKQVRLKNPPRIFYEVLRILDLHEVWDLKNIVER